MFVAARGDDCALTRPDPSPAAHRPRNVGRAPQRPRRDASHLVLLPRAPLSLLRATPAATGRADVQVPPPPSLASALQDIAIRAEGDYSLRFQFFDLESRTEEFRDDAPILAECFSQPFKVHAPRKSVPVSSCL